MYSNRLGSTQMPVDEMVDQMVDDLVDGLGDHLGDPIKSNDFLNKLVRRR